MTDTDLFTAGESTDANQLSPAVTTDTPDVNTNVSVGSLSTMVLPELRALANRAGVKGTSGMRKNELIAAIQESRGQANGTADSRGPSAEDSRKPDTASAEAEAPQGERNGSTTEAPRRERRGASREAGSPVHPADEAGRRGSDTPDGTATAEADNRHLAALSRLPVAKRGPGRNAGAQERRCPFQVHSLGNLQYELIRDNDLL